MKTKICSCCKKELPLSEFNKNKSRKDGLNNICRECSKESSKKYYLANKEEHKKNVNLNRTEYRKRNSKYIYEYKKKCGCKYCDEKEPVALDFHHLRDKKFLVGQMTQHSLEKLKEEIDKCEVICSNCHRKLHAGIKL